MVIHNSSAGHQLSLWILEIVGPGTGQEINAVELVSIYDLHLWTV